ncbi:hypothetical protein [Escherichia phage A221]|nr:hypothetical protein [Escherichia phage vB_EcoM-ZQ1]UHS65709.1 hypothetical protein RPN242_gp177 [Escherichia phage vB_EcoM-RPN242]UTQ72721.1 hypothetical protein [Escherichia phage A221]
MFRDARYFIPRVRHSVYRTLLYVTIQARLYHNLQNCLEILSISRRLPLLYSLQIRRLVVGLAFDSR